VVVSHASIIFPFTLGFGLAYFLYLKFAPPNIQFLSFALFMGIAMSITAFPVLARIVQERGLSRTRIGRWPSPAPLRRHHRLVPAGRGDRHRESGQHRQRALHHRDGLSMWP
jgi:hypothetical protein